MDGIIIVDKPKEYTSRDIVNIVGEVEESVLEYIIKYYDKGNIIPKDIYAE